MADENYQQYGSDPYAQGQANPYQQPAAQPYQQPYDPNAQAYQPTYDAAAQPYQQPVGYQPGYDATGQAYQQPYQQPVAQPYQQPYNAPMPQPIGYGAAAAGIEDKSTTYIVLSVVEMVMFGIILGILPLIFSIQYRNACNAGQAELAEKKRNNAKISLIVMLVLGILLVIGIAAGGGY